jgi:hypothetical protein
MVVLAVSCGPLVREVMGLCDGDVELGGVALFEEVGMRFGGRSGGVKDDCFVDLGHC